MFAWLSPSLLARHPFAQPANSLRLLAQKVGEAVDFRVHPRQICGMLLRPADRRSR
jgi:hypothetical protein